MSKAKLNQRLSYQEVNRIKAWNAGATAPSDPAPGEIWLDTTGDPPVPKRWNSDIATPAWEPIQIQEVSGNLVGSQGAFTGCPTFTIRQTGDYSYSPGDQTHLIEFTTDDSGGAFFPGPVAGIGVQITRGNQSNPDGGLSFYVSDSTVGYRQEMLLKGDGTLEVGGNEVHHAGNTCYDLQISSYGKMLVYIGFVSVPSGTGTVDVVWPYAFDSTPGMGALPSNANQGAYSSVSTTGVSFVKNGAVSYTVYFVGIGIRS